MIWTDAMTARVVALAAQGLDNGEIAAKMQLTPDSVHGKLYRIRVTAGEYTSRRFKWTEARDETVRMMRRAGRTWTEIAGALETTEAVIRLRAIYLGCHEDAPRPAGPAVQPEREEYRVDEALPPGNPIAWAVLTAGTSLERIPYPLGGNP